MADKQRDPDKTDNKQEYRGPLVVDKVPNPEPGLEGVPLFESFIAPVKTYRGMAQKLLSSGGEAASKAAAKYAKGGKVSGASKRADGIAQRGKTRGRII